MVGRVWPRHGHRGRPLNEIVRCHFMRVRWFAEYRGGDPANCRRKLVRVLGISAEDEEVMPWRDGIHGIQFFSTLEASSWASAVVELLSIASRFSARWEMTISPSHILATSNDRKVEHVESLMFEVSASGKSK
jgi:hypothetical protein